jgi:phenylacetate-CoA ligase
MDSIAHLDPALGTLSREQIYNLQSEQLLYMLPEAMSGSGLVNEVWSRAGVHPRDIRSLEDFYERAPFLSQDRVRQYRDEHGDPCGGISHMLQRRLTGIASTSGTTGNPSPVPLSNGSILERTMTRDLAWCMGLKRGEYLAYMLFAFRAGLVPHRYRGLGATQICLNHSPEDIPLLIEASLRFRPTVGYLLSAPMVWAIQRYGEKHKVDLQDVFASYRGFGYGGERLPQAVRDITDSWNLRMHEVSTLGDLGSATECEARDGFHGWEDFAILESLDPNNNQPVADGEIGELVITSLNDPAFALVRYRTDDLVRLTRERCRCGRTHARFWVMGRKGDEIKVGDRSIFPKEVTPLIEKHPELPAALYQLGKRSEPLDRLYIKLGYDTESLLGSLDALLSRVRNRLEDGLGVEVQIEPVLNSELLKLGPPHKIPRVYKL